MIVGLASLAGPLLVIARIVIFRVSGKDLEVSATLIQVCLQGGER